MNKLRSIQRNFSLFLVACMALALLPVPAQAGGDMAMPGVVPTMSTCGGNFVIKEDGSLWGLGGDFGATGKDWYQVKMAKIMESVSTVSSADGYAMVVKTDGSLWGFGRVMYGENKWHSRDLGNGYVEIDPTPFKIMDDVASVSCGDTYTFAVKKDGSLWAWGLNGFGQICNVTTDFVPYPVKIMDDVIQASAFGFCYSMALKKDGTLWRWGGENSEAVPKKITDGVIAFSDYAAEGIMVIKNDASLW